MLRPWLSLMLDYSLKKWQQVVFCLLIINFCGCCLDLCLFKLKIVFNASNFNTLL